MQVDDNVVYVGKKEVPVYIATIYGLFVQGHDKVILKARGRNNCGKVDFIIALIRERIDVDIDSVDIQFEEFERDGKKHRNVAKTVVLKKRV